jgi:DNA-binding NtrC family response regulator
MSRPSSPALPLPDAGALLSDDERRALERAAASTAPVLVLGEAGSGRSALARWLHAHSPRRHAPCLELDPSALPAELFEAELFGYRAGAFTGAQQAVPGRVGFADDGTLVLDRVEALPLTVQPKLLRLLSEGRYTPLGGRERQVDVRFVALAAEDLPERVERHAFRLDLFYRLEVLAFTLPPLRARPERLPALAAAMVADLSVRLGRSAVALAPSTLAWMQTHPWPGNLRQLRNVLERALVLSEAATELVIPAPARTAEAACRPLAELEEEAIRRALAVARGHQAEAARLLGISRKSLWERRKRFGIP